LTGLSYVNIILGIEKNPISEISPLTKSKMNQTEFHQLKL